MDEASHPMAESLLRELEAEAGEKKYEDLCSVYLCAKSAEEAEDTVCTCVSSCKLLQITRNGDTKSPGSCLCCEFYLCICWRKSPFI